MTWIVSVFQTLQYFLLFSQACVSSLRSHLVWAVHFTALWAVMPFLMIHVDAPQLDYSSGCAFLNSLAKHGDFGHAWIYLEGDLNGQHVCIEGGHSGESGCLQVKYLDGIMNYIDYGVANPTREQRRHRRYEPNPVKYLWASQSDGYFERSSGGHIPTFSYKINLTDEQFLRILTFIEPRNYHYREYSITHSQCCTFVAQVAALAGITLKYEVEIPIEQEICVRGRRLRLWEDKRYSKIRVGTPDALECSLKQMDIVDKVDKINLLFCPNLGVHYSPLCPLCPVSPLSPYLHEAME